MMTRIWDKSSWKGLLRADTILAQDENEVRYVSKWANKSWREGFGGSRPGQRGATTRLVKEKTWDGGGEETDWDGTHGVDATKSDSGSGSFLVPADWFSSINRRERKVKSAG
jgi:hypothetical protein